MKIDQNLVDALQQFVHEAKNAAPKPVDAKPNDFIESTMTYEHETPVSVNSMAEVTNTFKPIQPQETASTAGSDLRTKKFAPDFVLTNLEQDLVTVLKHLLVVEGQTTLTVENVFLQQLLRIIQRLELKIDSLEELITDEVLGYSDSWKKTNEENPQESLLVFKNGEEEVENINEVEWVEERNERQVQTGGGESKRKKGNARQRRRNRRNRKNRSKSERTD